MAGKSKKRSHSLLESRWKPPVFFNFRSKNKIHKNSIVLHSNMEIVLLVGLAQKSGFLGTHIFCMEVNIIPSMQIISP